MIEAIKTKLFEEGFVKPIRVMLNLFQHLLLYPFKAINGFLAKDPELNSG